jgi:hypothetical protein
VGDGEWMLRLLKRGVRMATLGGYTSVFTRTGANMSAGANARREARELFCSAPWWARRVKPLIILHHRLRRFLGGMYSQKPFNYELFTLDSLDRRRLKNVPHPRPYQ